MPINVQELYRSPNRLEQKRNFPLHVIIKTQQRMNIKIFNRNKKQVKKKGRTNRITPV